MGSDLVLKLVITVVAGLCVVAMIVVTTVSVALSVVDSPEAERGMCDETIMAVYELSANPSDEALNKVWETDMRCRGK